MFLSLSISLHSFLFPFFLPYVFTFFVCVRWTYCVAQASLDLELKFLLLQPLNTGVASMATTPGFSLVP